MFIIIIILLLSLLWQDSNTSINIQYDQYRNAKHVLKSIQTQHHHRITEELTSQGLIITSILKYASLSTTSLWSTVQKNMPKNIFNFTLKYLSNSLATRKNLSKWCITQSSACSFFQSETLQHIVSSCKSYLEQGRYTWRHDSVLNFIANTLSGLQSCSLYAGLPAFLSPSRITGDSLRPDLILISKNNNLYILELTIGFETNIKVNSDQKASKYNRLHQELGSKYKEIKFINLSLGALGSVGSSSESFINLLKCLKVSQPIQWSILSKMIDITIWCTYFIFCRRNNPWTDPDLLPF